jgi:tetratricopeptide (TPR) repeat protein
LLFANRSVARLKQGGAERSRAALADADEAARLAPDWPKAHFRQGQALLALRCWEGAITSFIRGRELEPTNDDWITQIERVREECAKDARCALMQVFFAVLPEALVAWRRGLQLGGDPQVLVIGQPSPSGADLVALGIPPSIGEGGSNVPKAQLRYAIIGKKEYAENYLAAASSTVSVDGSPAPPVRGVVEFFSASEIVGACNVAFEAALPASAGNSSQATRAFVRIPFDREACQPFMTPLKEPAKPPGEVDGALSLQKSSGFPRKLPLLLGFQNFTSKDLQFPIIDLLRDAPHLAK